MEQIIENTNYTTYQEVYKTMEHDHAYPNTNLVRLEKWFLKKPGKVLDHGCGYGENLIFLTTKGYEVTGVEISKDLVDFVRLKCRLRKVPETLYKLQVLTPSSELPFVNASFDHVISLGVLELLGDRGKAGYCLKELGRLLKPGGRMIVSTIAPGNSFVLAGKKISREQYYFDGKESFKNTPLKHYFYIPDDEKSFSSIFPSDCDVKEIGSWDNDYCGVKGKHYVALVEKSDIKKKFCI